MSGWTCQRVSKAFRCGALNSARMRKCYRCGKPRPAKRKPAHMRALEISYEEYVALNDGDRCGICGREPSPTRRLDRDHDHTTGEPRGLLCHLCNRALGTRMTAEWCLSAYSYLKSAWPEGEA